MLSFVLSAAMLMAQQEDPEALKRRLLAEVEKKLREEEERILRDIEKLIDEELKKGPRPTPAPTSRPTPAPSPSPSPSPTKPKGRGFLGVRTGPAGDDATADLKKRGFGGGVRIVAVVPDSPAAKAGLQEDDLIVAIGDEKIAEPQALPPIVQSKEAGSTITIRILRGASYDEHAIQVTLAPLPAQLTPPPESPEPKPPAHSEEELRERIKKFLEGEGGSPSPSPSPKSSDPARPADPPPSARPWLGVQPEDISDDVRSQLKIDAGVGVAIVAVTEESPAAKGGLQAGDILVKIDGQAVKGEEGLAKFMTSAKAGQVVKLTVLRKGSETELPVTLAKRR